MFVVAGCLNLKSDGAMQLAEICDPKRVLLIELDLRSKESLSAMLQTVVQLLNNNPQMGKLNLQFYYHLA